jgi:hypothetical protein
MGGARRFSRAPEPRQDIGVVVTRRLAERNAVRAAYAILR